MLTLRRLIIMIRVIHLVVFEGMLPVGLRLILRCIVLEGLRLRLESLRLR